MEKSLSQTTLEFSGTSENKTINPFLKPEHDAILSKQKPAEQDVEIKQEKIQKALSTRGRRSLKDIGLDADLIQIPSDELLFQKQYYSISEVATMFRVNQSLLRYWESEFDILQPRKNRKGDRFFRPLDIKNLLLIYDLLRRRKFTIEGAKDYLRQNTRADEKFATMKSLENIKAFLLELKTSL
jgi:DNA-binding transcriptional MerR regulator